MPRIRSLVAAVRSDPSLGRGTESYMDETQSDRELAFLIENQIRVLEREGKPATEENVLRGLTQLENLWRGQDAERFASSSETMTSKDYPFQPIKGRRD